MKTLCPQPIPMSLARACRVARVACCLVFLLGSVHLVRADTGFELFTPATNYFNFYDSDGITSDGTDPVSAFNGLPATDFVWNGVPNPPYYAPIAASSPWNSGSDAVFATAIPNAYASFILGNATGGANPTGVFPGTYPGSGVTLYLSNPTTTPYEIRFDWVADYSYTGTSSTTVGGPASPLQVSVSGNLASASDYYALAGGETIYGWNAPYSITATFGAGTSPGDHFPTTGTPLNPSAPWNGGFGPNAGSTSFINVPTAPFSGTLTVTTGQGVYVVGYLELVVDPGTVTLQLGSFLPPAPGITTYSNQPVIYFPSNPGTNFVLQTTTNLTTGPWVDVTNGVPISGFIITNPTSPAFYRLN